MEELPTAILYPSVTIQTALIYPSETARPLIKANVDGIAASMQKVGLMSPIFVKPGQHWGDTNREDCYHIVSGGHRFAAACRLGWKEITCVVSTLSPLHNELAEIQENLERANLDPSQRAAALSRLKVIYQKLYPETKPGANRPVDARWDKDGPGDHPYPSFSDHVAKTTGLNRRTIDKAVERGNAIGPEVAELSGTSLGATRELDALVKMPKPDRDELIKRAKAGERVSAIRKDGPDLYEDARRIAAKYENKQQINELCIHLSKFAEAKAA